MINLLKIFILQIFSLLPDSPFQEAFATMDTGFLPSLNWFLPVDICANIMLAWLDCILVYFVFVLIKNIVMAVIKSKLAAAAIAKFFV